MYKITNQTPKNWDDYIKLLMSAYKALHTDKTQGIIFGLYDNVEKSEYMQVKALKVKQSHMIQ